MPVLRRALSLAILLALALAVWLPAARPAHAQSGDTITIGLTDFPSTLDPGEAYDFNAWEVLTHLYVGLTRQVPGTLNYELALAASYRVSDDRLTWTFTLRDDIAFSDGTPITAQTFVDSVNRVLALRRGALAAVEPYVASVEATAAGELVFHLVRPVPFFLQLLALPPYFPQHPALAATDRPQPFPDALIGNGPYRLVSFAARDQIVLQANPAYTLGPQPATPTIVLRHFARSQDLRDALRQHAIDVAWRALYLGHLFELEDIPRLHVVEARSSRVFYLYFGQAREPTDDPLVREAITLLIARRQPIDSALRGHATPLTSLIPPEFPDAYAPLWPAGPDLPRAEATLRAAGYKERGALRLRLDVTFSQPVYGDPYADAVTQLARASFGDTDFVEYGVFADVEGTTFANVLEEGSATVAVFAWTPLVPHPHAYLFPLAHSSQLMPANARFASPEIDALLDQAALAPDPAAQGALYQGVAARLLEDFALVPLWQDHLQAVAWDDISGIVIEPNFLLHYDLLARQ